MARKSLSEQEISLTRESFCDTAYALYQQKDYEAITMRGIAKAMNCSPMMAYRYFENKEEVFSLLRAKLFNQLADALEQVSKEHNQLSYLAALGQAYITFARNNPDAYRLLYVVHLRQEIVHPLTDRAQKRTRKVLLQATTQAIESGQISGEPVVVAHALWASIHGLISLDLANQLTQGASFDELMPVVLHSVLQRHQPVNDQ